MQVGDVSVGPTAQCMSEELIALLDNPGEELTTQLGELEKPRASVEWIGEPFDESAIGEFGDLPAGARPIELGPLGEPRQSLRPAGVQPPEDSELRHRDGRVPLVEDAGTDALEPQDRREQLVAELEHQILARRRRIGRSRCVHYATIATFGVSAQSRPSSGSAR